MSFDDKDVVVKFGADSAGLESAMIKTAQSIEAAVGKMEAAMGNLAVTTKAETAAVEASIMTMGDAVKAVGTTIEGVMAGVQSAMMILAGGAIFSETVKAFQNETAEAKQLMNAFGLTAEKASELNVQLKLVGLSAEAYTGMALKMDRQLKQNEAGLNDMGIKTRDVNGNYLTQQELMQNGIQALMQYEQGTDRNAASMAIFGRNAQDAMKLLKLNAETQEMAADMAKKFGLVLNGEAMQGAKEYAMQMNATKIVVEGFMAKIGESLLPALIGLGQAFVQIGQSIMPPLIAAFTNCGTIFKAVGDIFVAVVDGIKEILAELGEMVIEIFGVVLPKNFDAAKFDIQLVETAVLGLKTTFLVVIDTVVMLAEKAINAFSSIYKGAVALLNFQSPIAASQEGMAKLDKINEEYTATMMGRAHDLRKAYTEIWNPAAKDDDAPGKQGHKHFTGNDGTDSGKSGKDSSYVPQWEAQLEGIKAQYMEENNLRELSKEAEVQFWQSALDQTNLTEAEITDIKRKMSKLRIEILKEQRKEEQGLAQESIKFEQSMAMESLKQDEEQAKLKYNLGQISFKDYQSQLQDFENKKYAIEEDALNKELELDKKSPNNAVKVQQDLDKALIAEKQHYTASQKITADTLTEQQRKWQDLFKSIGDGMGKAISGFIVGTQSLQSALQGIFSSIQQSFANLIGTMISGFLQEQAMSLLGIGQKQKEVPVTAASAGGKAAESVAGVPFAGPELAAAAYASTFAMIMGGLHSAAGGFDIPAGVNPLTQLHSAEMVLPAPIANKVRNMADGGGGGVTVHIHATDAQSVARLFSKNGPALADALKQQIRNFKR